MPSPSTPPSFATPSPAPHLAAALARRAQRVLRSPTLPTPDIASPCVGLCRMDTRTAYCEGCWRSIDEIMAWPQMDNTSKRQVWAHIAQRLQTPVQAA